MKLLYGSKFKRAFKKQVRRNPQLQDGILQALELLKDDPFTPTWIRTSCTGNLMGVGRVGWLMTAASFFLLPMILMRLTSKCSCCSIWVRTMMFIEEYSQWQTQF